MEAVPEAKARGFRRAGPPASTPEHAWPLPLPPAPRVTPGQRANCTQLTRMLDKIHVPRIRPGRPRKKPDSLATGITATGPCPAGIRPPGASGTRSRRRPTARPPTLRKSSQEGRPPGHTQDRYKKRTTTERAVNRPEQSRAAATHYGQRGYVFPGTTTAFRRDLPPNATPTRPSSRRSGPGAGRCRRKRPDHPGSLWRSPCR